MAPSPHPDSWSHGRLPSINLNLLYPTDDSSPEETNLTLFADHMAAGAAGEFGPRIIFAVLASNCQLQMVLGG
jgi:hypothetical protein